MIVSYDDLSFFLFLALFSFAELLILSLFISWDDQ